MTCWGIVGHEAAKFTPATEHIARSIIASLLSDGDSVVSGRCHLGGIDIWAIEEAKKRGWAPGGTGPNQWEEFPPEYFGWEAYKKRNIQIAYAATEVVSIVVKVLPASFTGRRFEFCYHCKTDTHVKSGGCWTAKFARGLGKPTRIIEI